MKRIFIGLVIACFMALFITSCAGSAQSALVGSAPEKLVSFMGVDDASEGTAKAVPGNVYSLGNEGLPGDYVYSPVDEQTTSITCHGLTFQFVRGDGGTKLILPGGQVTGPHRGFEVETTSCHFTAEFLPSGEKLLTIYK